MEFTGASNKSCPSTSAQSGQWPSFVWLKVHNTLLRLATKRIQLLFFAWMEVFIDANLILQLVGR
uniref:Uncharacterized protein n=1 Tax=Helianthus annuus TaxID=4232 RepID=A0A251TIR1_HELAN